MLKRFAFAFVAALLSACVSDSGGNEATSERAVGARRPNILLIVADDLGYGDLSSYGGTRVQTPNIDAIGAQGVRFTNGYVSAAVCAPSRAALLSGRRQQRFGYEFNPVMRDLDGVGMPSDVRILPEYLHERGYRSALIGKWHLGRTHDTNPLSHGFDRFFGFSPGATGYMAAPGEGDDWLPDPVPGTPRGFWDMRLEEGYERIPARAGYLTDILTDEAIKFMTADDARPFFLMLAYNAPHSPLQATRAYLERVSNIQDRASRIYAAMVLALDDNVGRVMAALNQHGLANNTLVVFLSDNGCPHYIGPGVCSNAPNRGFKGMYLEGGVRVPMMASWPGHLPSGAVYDSPVMSIDWTRSFLALAGADTTGQVLDGIDVFPLIASGAETPDRPFVWRVGPNYSVRHGDWKLIVADRTDGNGQLTYLFNLRDDPAERNNLAQQQPEILARLTHEFQAWNAQMPPPSFVSERVLSLPLEPGDPPVQLYN